MTQAVRQRSGSIARLVLLGLVLGSLTTVFSSWLIGALAASPSSAAATVVHDPTGPKIVFAGSSIWRAEVLWQPDDGFRSDPPETDQTWNRTPAWVKRAIRTAPPQTIYLAAGWPALAMHMTVRDNDPAVLAADYEARGGLLFEYRRDDRRRAITLPLTPHWPAFALNSALFGAWWALGLSFLGSARRTARTEPVTPAAPAS